jgi:hypothetical protein
VTLRHVGFTPVPPGPKPGFDHADTYGTRTGGRLYVAHTGADAVGSPGTVSAFDVRGRFHRETIETEEGAHTIGWDPASRRLFVFQARSCGVAIYEESS